LDNNRLPATARQYVFLYAVGIGFNIKTIHRNLARCFIAQGFNNFQRSGFTRAVRAKQAEDLAFVNFKANALYRLKIAVVFYQVFNRDNRLCLPYCKYQLYLVNNHADTLVLKCVLDF
jgi:hypothetical protein